MPGSGDELFGAAVQLHRAGRMGDAEQAYVEVLKTEPRHFDALNLLGAIHAQKGDAAKAAELFQRAVQVNPNVPTAHSNLGLAFRNLNKPVEALEQFDRALALKADYPIALNNRGLVLGDLGRWEEAVVSFDRGLALAPEYIEAQTNRAVAVNMLLNSYDALLQQEPNYPEALYNRGCVLQDLQRFDEALASLDRALLLKPGDAQTHYMRGLALQALGRHSDALAAYDLAVTLKPDHPARLTAAYCALLMGQFARGWKDYELRLQGQSRRLPQPQWNGTQPIEGKTILLHAEQGVGDTIQFARYVSLLAERGANVILEVQAPLKTLMKGIEGVGEVIVTGDSLPTFDLHCPLMSVPGAMGTNLTNIPHKHAYLTADLHMAQRWQKTLGTGPKRRVGLVWSGRPDHANDRNRSIPLEKFSGLLARPADFVSLQKDVRQRDQAALATHVHMQRVTETLMDFAETAAVISCLDLVIAVDTAVAHLAAALGKPVWLLLPYVPDWRWLLNRDDSPWYPTVRLFRQPMFGDWASVMPRVEAELGRFLA